MPEDWGLDMPTVGYCAFCPDWKIEGTALEVTEICREHRAELHADLPPPTRRRRANLRNWRATLNPEETLEVDRERARRLRLLGIEPEE